MKVVGVTLQSLVFTLVAVYCRSTSKIATNACAFESFLDSDPEMHVLRSSGGGLLVCADFQCQYGRITKECDTIQCIGTQSCESLTILDTTTVECTGQNSCNGVTIDRAENVECRGSHGYHACTRAKMNNVTRAICGQNACEYARIRGGQFIQCSGPHSCGSFFEPDAAILNAKYVECSGETDVCGGASCEGYVTIDAESVVCSGRHACSGATITANCLSCSGDCSCGGAGIDFPTPGSALCTFSVGSDPPEEKECEIGLNGKCFHPI
eukprot:scaffold374_cov160-Amphora_coffeaeformis.AAC.5